MKKYIYFLIYFLLISFMSFGQQVQNGGFEEWELIPEINLEEPVNWSSIKTTTGGSLINNGAPKVWDKSTDARTGNYSLKLTNIPAFGVVATGMVTNGRVFTTFNPSEGYSFTDPADERWHTAITSRPDSLIGWYKQTPSEGDFATVRVMVHKGSAKIPDANMVNWIGDGKLDMPTGEVSQWTRFSVPITYLNDDEPEFVLIILTSGNGTDAVAGSVAWFDDIELVYGPAGISRTRASYDFHIFIQNNTLHLQNIPSNMLEGSELELLDMTGRTVWKGKAVSTSTPLGFSLRDGVYIFRMIYQGEVYSVKVVAM